MLNGNSKRVIVIRDIPSNVVEEAILVLKSDMPARGSNSAKDANTKKRNHDFLLKEAEMIINSCIKENRLAGAAPGSVVVKKPWTTNKVLVNTVINTALIGSIAVLIFLITRMF